MSLSRHQRIVELGAAMTELGRRADRPLAGGRRDEADLRLLEGFVVASQFVHGTWRRLMPADATKACERDLKRFDDLTTRFETAGLVLGFVNLFLAVWVRAPGLQMDPGSGTGLTLAGFNVGYAIVYGPVVGFLTMLFFLSLLERRDAVRAQIIVSARNLLKRYRTVIASRLDALAAQALLCERPTLSGGSIWYVFLPPATAVVTMLRYFDFVPDESAKAWTFWGRAQYLLLETRGWETRPILPDHALEAGKDLMGKLPYIYPPAASWAEIALVIATAFMAARVSRLTRTRTPQQPAPRTRSRRRIKNMIEKKSLVLQTGSEELICSTFSARCRYVFKVS